MNKKALITGADGFIGSHLVEQLVRDGYQVRAFACYNSFNSWGWLDTLSKDILSEIEVITGDVRDPFQIEKAAKEIDSIFHLAALIAIPYSYTSPQSYVDTNITGTLNILEAARTCNTSRVLITSTSEVYGTALQVPIDETHPRQAQSPYAATKIAADALADSYYRSFGVPVTIVRPFNTYGPRQSARAVIPTIISQLTSGFDEIRLGNLTPTRDFNYVKDTCEGFSVIAKTDALIGEEVNIATEKEVSIGELAEELIRQIRPEARIVTEQDRLRPDKSEVERLLGSNKKLLKLTGWQPKHTFEQGIAETIDWFSRSENLSRYKPELYNQ